MRDVFEEGEKTKMIYITGDTHIPTDIHKLNVANFPVQRTLSKSDCVIICGDFGGVWSGSKEDDYWLKWLDTRNFTTLFVDGNHENHRALNEEYDVITYCGGKAHKIMDSVYHLMRGQVFTIEGMKFFTMGGARSHDLEYRTEGISWWPEEMPSKEEYAEAARNLAKHDNKVDYVITHCAPDSIQWEIDETALYGCNELTGFLETVKNEVSYKHWYYGHYHYSRDIDDKHTCLYDKIIELSG